MASILVSAAFESGHKPVPVSTGGGIGKLGEIHASLIEAFNAAQAFFTKYAVQSPEDAEKTFGGPLHVVYVLLDGQPIYELIYRGNA